MTDFTTEVVKRLTNKDSLMELFRKEMEKGINEVIQLELTGFLGYEKYAIKGHHSGNSRNGCYQRTAENLERTIILMYSKGMTTREIAELIEKMYGQYYTPQTVSNITKVTQKQVEKFHNRPIASRYSVIYGDATMLNLRRDSVAKEAVHILAGITPEGQKEILDYRIYPEEASENYYEMLMDLKRRGLKEVLLFVTDGLTGLQEACLKAFPKASYQRCWVHVSRTVMKRVRVHDRKDVMEDLKAVYQAADEKQAQKNLKDFLDKHSPKYPKLKKLLEQTPSLFTFYRFPKAIRRSIYTTNLIESLNKKLKRSTKRKEQFPNEAAMERYLYTVFNQYNRKFSQRVHKGFGKVTAEILELFDVVYNN